MHRGVPNEYTGVTFGRYPDLIVEAIVGLKIDVVSTSLSSDLHT